MFTKTLALLSLTAATVLAAPTTLMSRQSPAVTITLIDATQHEYPVIIPSTQSWTPTFVSQSISTVKISNTGYVPCVFFGIDGLVIFSMPGDVKEMAVGPPQVIVGGTCGPFGQQ